MTGRLVVVLLGWALYSLVKSGIRNRHLVAQCLTAEAERDDARLWADQWQHAYNLATGDPWSPQDVDGARAHGIDLSRVYEDDRHRGDVL